MSNSFDFEIKGNDQASQVAREIDEAFQKLYPQLQKTRDGLQLGGQETVDGLNGFSGQLAEMSRAARDNVQFIGDMVPPLKMVGELGMKYGGIAGKMGLIGAGAYGLAKGGMAAAEALKQASQNAYNLDTAAANAGMRVDEFSRLSGAMQILGSDSDSANDSVQGLYHTFNEALQGRNSGVLALLSQMGVQITKNKDGTADVMRTMESLARIFPSLAPEKQKTVADALGLDANGLTLLREGARLKELLTKADQFGLTVDPAINKQLSDFNMTLNSLSASWEGLKKKTKEKLFGGLLSDGSVKDGMEGIQDVLTNGVDSISLSHVLGGNRGKEAEQLRWGYNNPEFYNSLGLMDKVGLDFGVMTDGFRDRYNARERTKSAADQLQGDMAIITGPQTGTTVPGQYGQEWNNALGLRNNNPGNLRAAPNTNGRNGGFSTFDTSQDGLSAMARQLMLYGDRGNNTLDGVINTYAPGSENNTGAYINAVSGDTGYSPNQQLDLHDPATLKTLMSAMIKHENGTQPYSEDDISSSINSAIYDDRWKGLRNPSILENQRQGVLSEDGGLGLSNAFRTALEDTPLKVELTIVDEKTGTRRQTSTSSGGRVTVPMQSP